MTGGTFTYDGQPHAVSGSTAGINGADLGTPDIFYIGNETMSRHPSIHGGTYTVSAFFAGTGDYALATTTALVTINPALPAMIVTGGTFTYDGQPHAASGSVVGVNGADLGTPNFTYIDANGVTSASPPTDVGTYTVTASFTGSSDYVPISATATITINAALRGTPGKVTGGGSLDAGDSNFGFTVQSKKMPAP